MRWALAIPLPCAAGGVIDKQVIDKQVSAPRENRCSMFEAASLINTQPWLSLLPTGFQMTAAGVIRALGSPVSEIITG